MTVRTEGQSLKIDGRFRRSMRQGHGNVALFFFSLLQAGLHWTCGPWRLSPCLLRRDGRTREGAAKVGVIDV